MPKHEDFVTYRGMVQDQLNSLDAKKEEDRREVEDRIAEFRANALREHDSKFQLERAKLEGKIEILDELIAKGEGEEVL